MERKSAQNGSRSADERSPDGSERARRDGAHHKKSASFSDKKSGKKGMRKGDSFKKGPAGKRFGDKKGSGGRKFGDDAGWSPNIDARRETPDERAMRGADEYQDRSERNDRRGDRKGREEGRRFGESRPRKSFDAKKRPASSAYSHGNKPFKSATLDNKPKGPAYTPPTRALEEGERIAKIMARAGLCSRRDAETWIKEGRVTVNGKVLETPAVNIHPNDKVLVDGAPLPVRERTRLWLYHKPRGLVTTTSDPEGRPTVFEKLPEGLPRVITVGRLDINTEGLLLLTNDGGLARVLELPSTGWLRRYRVRAYGKVTQSQLDSLADGIALDGVLYGSIDAELEREVGDNVWITVALREGKNREVKKVLGHLGLDVNRLIRVSYGPFQLLDLDEGKVTEVRGRILRDQLGDRLVEEAGADFDAPILTETPKEVPQKPKKEERKSSGGAKGGYLSAKEGARVMSGGGGKKRFEDRDDRDFRDRGDRDSRGDRGGRGDRDGRGERGGRSEDRGNAIPYAERKPFDPTAPRRTNFVYREEGADGKKTQGRSVRKVGGRPQKADLLDPNARIEKRKPSGPKAGGKGGFRSGGKGAPRSGSAGPRGGSGGPRGSSAGPRGGSAGPRGRSGRDR